MGNEKDRLGEKLRDKQKGEEDRYFSARDRELLEKLKQQKAAGAEAAPGAMLCPRDGTALVEIDQHGVTIEECPQCGGMWFDKGEVETVAAREKDSWLGRLIFGPRQRK